MRYFSVVLLNLLLCLGARADKGMWLPNRLKETCAMELSQAGCALAPEAIYDPIHTSLKDAVVRFGNGCTGEVVSTDGLVLTNHHCGYEYVQALSTVEHDYLRDGFAAPSREQELPCKGLKVRFLQYMEDITETLLKDLDLPDDPQGREELLKVRKEKYLKDLQAKDSTLDYVIAALYYGNTYYLYAYKTYTDVRLVVAPPSSIGKFGGDTDNWMWPRHTGDFTLFRIYASENNEPADFSMNNRPYHPKEFFKINVAGVKEDDFVMVYGYPGRTQQYLTSEAVASVVRDEDPRKVALRRKRLDVMDRYMKQNDTLYLQYASKYANVANAWKKWIGEASGLERVEAIEQKQAQEKQFAAFANTTAERKEKYSAVLPALATLYQQLTPLVKAADYYTQGLMGIECLAFAVQLSKITESARKEVRSLSEEEMKSVQNLAEEFFKDYDLRVDQSLVEAMLEAYLEGNTTTERLLTINKQVSDLKGISRFQHKILRTSFLTNAAKFRKELGAKNFLTHLAKDKLFVFAENLNEEYKQTVQEPLVKLRTATTGWYRKYVAGLMEMHPEQHFFPDANSTLRLAFGKIEGYTPREGISYLPFTTLEGLVEKVRIGAHDYIMPERLRALYQAKDYGQWAVEGSVPACFLASVHTTGGNSGSPALNARGELVGLNFDRVWEGTMSDIMFDSQKCRNIVVDIRYVLFMIEKYAQAPYLLEEMVLVR
ncbi:MAG: S46 family peptidase [Bacteroides sp.]